MHWLEQDILEQDILELVCSELNALLTIYMKIKSKLKLICDILPN